MTDRLTDDELDALLATISRGGYVSLGTRRDVQRLATEVRERRTEHTETARVMRKAIYEATRLGVWQLKDFAMEWLARYEEGGR